MNYAITPLIVLIGLLVACHPAAPPAEEATPPPPVTPATVIKPQTGAISDSLELTASSSYLQNSYIKATANGYVKAVQIKPGDFVQDGQKLFTIETKESTVIGNAIANLDSSFHFSGILSVKAMGHGYVTQLNHQAGDYVQDGEQLAVISDRNSFVFLLNMPYEDRNVVLKSKAIWLLLPDGTRLKGIIGTVFPTVDSVTQTQTVTLRVSSDRQIPQNLIARVHVLRELKSHAITVPRAAILTDEAQSGFWVMQLIDSGTAVKVPVKKGLEFTDKVEITDPVFTADDRILVSGNYGLPDTAKVTIEASKE